MESMQPKESPPTQKLLFLGVTLMFVISWSTLIARLFRHWQDMPNSAHYWAFMFALLYPASWLLLLSEKPGKKEMALLTYFALFAAMKSMFP